MLIVPSIDIRHGRCVKLIQGKPGTGLVLSATPLEAAKAWQDEGAKRLHIVDLDGALEGTKNNRPLVEAILESLHIPVQVGGGIRSVDDVKYYLKHGASWVILGTAVFVDPSFLRKLRDEVESSRVIIALDYKDDMIVTQGWQKTTKITPLEAIRRMDSKMVYGFLVTDVDAEGMMRGVRVENIKALVNATRKPIIYAGGVSKLNDIAKLASIGVDSVVVGRALYERRFTLKQAEDTANATSR